MSIIKIQKQIYPQNFNRALKIVILYSLQENKGMETSNFESTPKAKNKEMPLRFKVPKVPQRNDYQPFPISDSLCYCVFVAKLYFHSGLNF